MVKESDSQTSTRVDASTDEDCLLIYRVKGRSECGATYLAKLKLNSNFLSWPFDCPVLDRDGGSFGNSLGPGSNEENKNH